MINVLSGIGYGIIGFAVIIVIGIVVIGKLGASVATCGTGFSFNSTSLLCQNITNASHTTASTTTAFVTGNSIIGYMGTSGLAGWIPAVIAVAIGGLFMVYFGNKKGY